MPVTIRPVLAIDYSPAAALGAGATSNVDLTAARPMDIYEMTVVPTATVANSTAQLQRQALGAGNFNTVSNAIAMAASGTVGRTTTVTAAERSVAATDVLRVAFVDGGAGGANGRAYVRVCPTAIAGQ